MKIIYEIPGSLKEVLHVIKEVAAITGMEPVEVVTDEKRKVRFDKANFLKLEKGDMDEEKYIFLNSIS